MSLSRRYAQLDAWYASRAGRAARPRVRARLAEMQAEAAGDRALYCGPAALCGDAGALPGRLRRWFRLHPGAGAGELRARPEVLPVAPGCLDFLVLAHALELSDRPHEVLREADRTLAPHGCLLLAAFNPWSWYGLRRLLPGGGPWDRHFYGAARIRDWLSVLNFRVEDARGAAFRPPLQSELLQRRLRGLERQEAWRANPFGGVHCIRARKLRAPLTPERAPWYQSAAILPGRLAEQPEPSARGAASDAV